MKNTKNIALLGAVMAFGLSVKAQNTFAVHGQLSNDKQGKIVIHYYRHEVFMQDSAVVINGKFELKGDIGDPCYADICLNPPASKQLGEEYDSQPFFLEGTVNINSTSGIAAAKITGGKSQTDYLAMKNVYAPFEVRKRDLEKQGKALKAAANDTALTLVGKQIDELELQVRRAEDAFVKSRPDSHVSFRLWARKHRGIVDPELEPEYQHFSQAIRDSEAGKKMWLKIEMAKKLSSGNQAPDFSLKDTLGNTVSLSSFKGKNVLLYFWFKDFFSFKPFAFNMRRLAKRLSDENLAMFGVYYNGIPTNDPSEDRWKAAVSENGLSWTNVYDVGGLDQFGAVSTTAKAYGNESSSVLPIIYLIGPDGKILARNLKYNDPELSSKIENLIK